MWYYKHVGGERCPIVDTFWQTETGGHMITPLLAPRRWCRVLHPAAAGHHDRHRRRTGNDVPNGSGGILVVRIPWPSMIRTIWGDPSASRRATSRGTQGYYLAGDGAVRASADRLLPHHRPASTTCSTSRVTAWARWRSSPRWSPRPTWSPRPPWWAVPDDLTGEAIVAFVVLKCPIPTGDDGADCQRAAQLGRQGDRPDRCFQGDPLGSARTCPRPARARSCAACCVCWLRASVTQDTSTLENPHPRPAGTVQLDPGLIE